VPDLTFRRATEPDLLAIIRLLDILQLPAARRCPPVWTTPFAPDRRKMAVQIATEKSQGNTTVTRAGAS
jgi:hypothetical protein